MNGSRYIALIARRAVFASERVAAFERVAKTQELIVHRVDPRCYIAATPANATFAGHGMLIGRCQEADGKPIDDRTRKYLASYADFAEVTSSCWGDYVLIRKLSPDDAVEVLRSPVGELPCYYADAADATLIASDMDLMQKMGLEKPRVAWTECARFLLATELRREATCLEGVSDLPGGTLVRITPDRIDRRAIWSPWRFADHSQQVRTPEEGAAVVRTAVLAALAGQISYGQRSVLLLSGGLDSSIVGAALARNDREFACLNMVTRDKAGDEREHARAVASSIDRALVERHRDLSHVDLERSEAAGRPRPTASVFRQSTERAARDFARSNSADLIIDGGGGDNLFCSLQSVAPAVDRLRCAGPGKGFVSTCNEIATLAHASVWTVGWRAAQRLLSGRVRYGWNVDASFLTTSTFELLASTIDHPWLDHPERALPGAAAHVGLLLAASNLAGSGQSDPGPYFCSPLVSQPVLEAVLRVPSWMWFHAGRNRAVARAAFANDLPQTILHRRSKGTPAGFMAEIVEQRRDIIRAMLLDGLLVRNGVVDRITLERSLAVAGPARDFSFARILQLVDVEAWARSWA